MCFIQHPFKTGNEHDILVVTSTRKLSNCSKKQKDNSVLLLLLDFLFYQVIIVNENCSKILLTSLQRNKRRLNLMYSFFFFSPFNSILKSYFLIFFSQSKVCPFLIDPSFRATEWLKTHLKESRLEVVNQQVQYFFLVLQFYSA